MADQDERIGSPPGADAESTAAGPDPVTQPEQPPEGSPGPDPRQTSPEQTSSEQTSPKRASAPDLDQATDPGTGTEPGTGVQTSTERAGETEPSPEAPSGEEPAPTGEQREPQRFRPVAPSGARRLWHTLTKRPQASHVGVGALVCLLSFAALVQVRGDEEDALANARRDELLQIYDGLTRQGERLEEQIQELRQDREDLISSADSEGVALEQAQDRIRQLEVVAGVAATTGPGIQLTITDPEAVVGENLLLAAVMELRSAGAEAIQIEGVGNGEAVRVVASTYFRPAEDGVIVSGRLLQPTYVITAIGDPESLDEAMNFPQGVVSSIQNDRDGAEATVTQFNELTVDVLHEVEESEFTSPAPEDE